MVNLTNYGAFVELEPGVEGLVHISELSWTKKIKHPKQMLKVGDNVKAIILTTSKDDKRISLGIKQMAVVAGATHSRRIPSLSGKRSATSISALKALEETTGL